ncbi:unnamed protein product [Lactuca virosa]|uniref:Uncharacterized protein n=1 Tax=Lactuca virosa TaxID=75947 RepID=A0AAU9LD94_9ASTR|nr:unnamed protein product [Lactuca virosa]
MKQLLIAAKVVRFGLDFDVPLQFPAPTSSTTQVVPHSDSIPLHRSLSVYHPPPPGLVNPFDKVIRSFQKPLSLPPFTLPTASNSLVVCCFELWHACARPLISLPKKGNAVVYCPQGHLEQLQSSGDGPTSGDCNLPPHVFCCVLDVKLHAEAGTDDVYAQVSLIQDPKHGRRRKKRLISLKATIEYKMVQKKVKDQLQLDPITVKSDEVEVSSHFPASNHDSQLFKLKKLDYFTPKINTTKI